MVLKGLKLIDVWVNNSEREGKREACMTEYEGREKLWTMNEKNEKKHALKGGNVMKERWIKKNNKFSSE